MSKGKPTIKSAVEKILKKKGLKYNDWKEDILNEKKLEIMANKDRAWTNTVIAEASNELIVEAITETPEVFNENKNYQNQNEYKKETEN